MMHLGIDTDAAGGLALLGHRGGIIRTWTAPTRNAKWHDADARALAAELREAIGEQPCRAVIEEPTMIRIDGKIRPVPTRAVALMAGRYLGICCAMGLGLAMVTAKQWQAAMLAGVPGADTKDRSVRAARLLWPAIDLQPGRRKTDQHGVADAALMAEYDRRRL